MKKDLKFFLKLFFYTFKLSAFTFGGGYVIVPLIKKQFVDELHWIDENEMLDYIAIAQSSPGAMAVNASVLIGYRLAGVPGALTTIIATVTPPLIIISIISLFYEAFAANEIVRNVLTGMQAGVCAVIISVVFDMAYTTAKKRRVIDILMMPLAFAAVFIFKVNILVVILVSAAVGLAGTYISVMRMK